jgi:PBP1b-binding outer membrane lipoprotein LpoB
MTARYEDVMKLLIITLSAVFLNGCAGYEAVTGTDAAKVAGSIGHIKPSRDDTCQTQKQIAEQSSKIDTIIKGKEVVYKAPPCEARTS